ncbi:MAG: hypothetical protein WCW16_00910 [Candidatus Magasanikbacteria bacterium]
MWLLVLQRMAFEVVIDILYFPIWWFTAGARHALMFCVNWIREVNGMLAPGLWLKNIFVPMFGQWDWQGRIMSFFMRVMNVIVRTIGLIIWTALMMVVFILWIVFPIFVFYLLLGSVWTLPV